MKRVNDSQAFSECAFMRPPLDLLHERVQPTSILLNEVWSTMLTNEIP